MKVICERALNKLCDKVCSHKTLHEPKLTMSSDKSTICTCDEKCGMHYTKCVEVKNDTEKSM